MKSFAKIQRVVCWQKKDSTWYSTTMKKKLPTQNERIEKIYKILTDNEQNLKHLKILKNNEQNLQYLGLLKENEQNLKDLGSLKNRLDTLDKIMITVDKIAGGMQDYRTEQELNANKLSEHQDDIDRIKKHVHLSTI